MILSYLLLLKFIRFVITAEVCGWPFASRGDGCYHVVQNGHTRDEAETQCSQLNASLVNIETRSEFDEVIAYLTEVNTNKDYWTSGRLVNHTLGTSLIEWGNGVVTEKWDMEDKTQWEDENRRYVLLNTLGSGGHALRNRQRASNWLYPVCERTPAADGTCESPFEKRGNSCYCVVQEPKDWDSAAVTCSDMSATLVSIETINEYDEVLDFILPIDRDCWTSGVLVERWSEDSEILWGSGNITEKWDTGTYGGWDVKVREYVDINKYGSGELYMRNMAATDNWLYPVCERASRMTEDVGESGVEGTVFETAVKTVIVRHEVSLRHCSKLACAARCLKYDECTDFALYVDEGEKCWCQLLQSNGGGRARTDIYTKN